MTAEVFRVEKNGREVKNRDLRAGELMYGNGLHGDSPIPVFVRITGLEKGSGMMIQLVDKNKDVDETSTVHCAAEGPGYTLVRRWSNTAPTIFHVYPH